MTPSIALREVYSIGRQRCAGKRKLELRSSALTLPDDVQVHIQMLWAPLGGQRSELRDSTRRSQTKTILITGEVLTS